MVDYEALIAERERQLLSRWDREDRTAKEKRANRMAIAQVAAELETEIDRDPESWRDRMEVAGCVSLALSWPGCGAAPNEAIRKTPYGFSIVPTGQEDEAGWYYKPENGEAGFVCSPVVLLGLTATSGRFSVRDGQKWKTVEVPQLRRGQEGRWHEAVLAKLVENGLRFGQPIVWRNYSGEQEREQPAKLLIHILFGVGADGGIGVSPVVQVPSGRSGRKGLRRTLEGR